MSSASRRRVLRPDPEEEIQRCDKRIQELEALVSDLNKTESDRSRQSVAGSPARITRDEEEIQHIVQRLVRPLPREEDTRSPMEQLGHKQAPPKILTAGEVAEVVDRLGVADLATRQGKLSELLQVAEDSLPLKKIMAAKGEDALVKLDGDQQAALGDRLCTQALATRKEKLTEMREQALRSAIKQSSPLSKTKVRECALRLCDGSLSKRSAEMSKLESLYMQPLVEAKKLSKAEMESSGSRLTKRP